jgi:hypothetical protein
LITVQSRWNSRAVGSTWRSRMKVCFCSRRLSQLITVAGLGSNSMAPEQTSFNNGLMKELRAHVRHHWMNSPWSRVRASCRALVRPLI